MTQLLPAPTSPRLVRLKVASVEIRPSAHPRRLIATLRLDIIGGDLPGYHIWDNVALGPKRPLKLACVVDAIYKRWPKDLAELAIALDPGRAVNLRMDSSELEAILKAYLIGKRLRATIQWRATSVGTGWHVQDYINVRDSA